MYNQFMHLALTTLLGNSQQSIFQTISTIRTQIIHSFWTLQQESQYLDLYSLQVPQIVPLSTSSQFIPNYDKNTEQCLYCIGWGLVDVNNLMTFNPQLGDLSVEQYSQLQQIAQTFQILQILYNSNFQLNYIYYHFANQMFVQYPFVENDDLYSKSPLQQMKKSFNQSNMHTAFLIEPTSETDLESCVSLLGSDNNFMGIVCLGINALGQQVFVNNLYQNIEYQGEIYSFFCNQNLNIFTTNTVTQYVNGSIVKNYGFPNLIDVVFNNSNQNSDQFLKLFYDIVYPNQEAQYIQLVSSVKSNVSTMKQILQNEQETFINDSINPLFQLSSILIQYDIDYYKQFLDFVIFLSIFFEQFSSGIQNETFVNIMTIAIPLAVIMCVIAWYISYRIIQSVSKPINDLTHKLELIAQDTLAIQIYSNFRQSSLEVNLLYDALDQLVTVLNFSNDRYFEGDDTSLLIKYAQGKALFQKMKSNKGMGMILNNIGNIHRRQQRYIEAIQCYRESIALCEDDLRMLLGDIKLLEVKRLQKGISIDISGESRFSQSGSKRVSMIEREIQTSQLEDIYSSRNFSLANVLIEYADNNQSLSIEEKRQLYKESLECLNITLSLDQKDNKGLLYRQIISHILQCKVLLNLEDSNSALAEISNAEQLSDKYENSYDRSDAQVNDSFPIPPGILKQRILYEKGLFIKRYDSIKKAAFIFTECLETSKFYDPEIRINCLKQLKEIFQSQNLLYKVPKIEQLLELNEIKKNNDIVFVIDHSGSMENIKKELAINGILKIFDNYLQDQDRISYMRFNQNIEVIFDLTSKSENTAYLRSAIERSKNIRAEGMTAMLSAVLHAYSIHEKAVKKDNQQWIVVLCDGEDNLSNITYERMKKFTSKRPQISLIVIGIGLSLKPDCLDELYDLCRLSQKGFLIESVYSEDLDIAFQSISNLIFGTSSIYDERLN
ncbi:unnamed protein product (macronuclear) [Paramecium tetraurelia]|uniref:VWFA domain-containing protein n=1 Tax=Paramecium tetraurelia TaxID=5888 RepID=A0BS51_PARTE|nr:uncharacterized protein GSPATT00031599001 [Paramecium tetraurelia]CAK61368.1 unnamed protein product [Paramecium tetraurelia]|eukprot:XP_001428766.1 hypothetical protein (macronuclear) [Paramecium tetraurelia strain d4-2]